MNESGFSSVSVKEEIELSTPCGGGHGLFQFYGENPDLDVPVSRSDPEAAKFRADGSRNILHEFVDCDAFGGHLDPWLLQKRARPFDAPFDLIDLQKFDFSLEGVLFQQLTRMPPAASPCLHSPTPLLSLEDFVYTAVKGVWDAFWGGPFPFRVACRPAHVGPARDLRLSDSAGAVVVTGESPDRVLLFALLRPCMRGGSRGDGPPSAPVLREAVFYALRSLLAGPAGVFFVLLFDRRQGSVVRVEGDAGGLRAGRGEDAYRAAAEWVVERARIAVSSVEGVWNELGNPDWGGTGVLRSLLAVFHSIVRHSGHPPHSVDDVAADHSSRLQARRAERGSGRLLLPRNPSDPPEIVELPDGPPEDPPEGPPEVLEPGSLVWLEGSDRKKGYRVERVCGGGVPSYVASPAGEPTTSVFLFVGPHPTQGELTWQDMVLWYMVQRQAKVLKLLRERGAGGRNLPEVRGYGRAVGRGRLLLATSPVGETVVEMARGGRFGRREALRCCHDLLAALAASASAGVRHGDVCPENAVFVGEGGGYFVLAGWGRAVLEERDRPAMNLHYSSTYALQEGRLCSGSDVESLVYLLYHSAAGGELPDLDSVEGALRWRERSWSRRAIQKRLGEASPLLKAFADYVDSLCGTPYPIDYDIWLRRLKRSIPADEDGRIGHF